MARTCWFGFSYIKIALPKFEIDGKHDGLENVSLFKYGYFDLFWVSMLDFSEGTQHHQWFHSKRIST